jgi:hypothetical protein
MTADRFDVGEPDHLAARFRLPARDQYPDNDSLLCRIVFLPMKDFPSKEERRPIGD